jgi:hypothetical protein
MSFSDTVAKVVDLATAIRDYWDTELPKRHPNYPIVSPGEDSGPPPPEEAELKRFLKTLSDEEIYKLVLLMCLGRGDFDTEQLTIQYAKIRDRFRERERAVSQIAGKAALADYLSDGVAELLRTGTNIDELLLAPARSGG